MEREKKRVELKDVLLPTEVKPIKYAIEISPHFETFSFDGFETIQLNGPSTPLHLQSRAKRSKLPTHPAPRSVVCNQQDRAPCQGDRDQGCRLYPS